MEQFKGLSAAALENRRLRGKFIQGVHWKKIHGIIMYHFERVDELFEELPHECKQIA